MAGESTSDGSGSGRAPTPPPFAFSPPPLPAAAATPSDEVSRAALALKRTVQFARFSAATLLALGGVSAVVCVRDPLSPRFLVSIAVVATGAIEWRLARRLAEADARAPSRLALNQLALGAAIAIYAGWQAVMLSPAAIEALLARPLVSLVLESAPSEAAYRVAELLPGVVKLLYAIVGAGALIGCAATAAYYQSRRRHCAVIDAAKGAANSRSTRA